MTETVYRTLKTAHRLGGLTRRRTSLGELRPAPPPTPGYR